MINTRFWRRFAPAVFVLIVVLAEWCGSVAAATYRTVALTGQPAPGARPDVSFSLLGLPQINAMGQTAFGASLEGASVDATNRNGFWSEGGGSLRLVARTGSAAPGLGPDVIFGRLGGSVFNDAGQTIIHAQLEGPGVDDTNYATIWLEQNGVLHLVARDGSVAPGTGGAKFLGLRVNNAVLNGGGKRRSARSSLAKARAV